jgi:hypothetical protein
MNISVMNSKDNWNIFSKNRNAIYGVAIISIMIFHFFEDIANSSLPKYLSNFPYFTGFSAHSLVK